MSITNTAKPSTSYTNTARDLSATTWANITTTWASETRTWAGSISDMTNTARVTFGSQTFDDIGDRTIDTLPYTFDSSYSKITNVAKP